MKVTRCDVCRKETEKSFRLYDMFDKPFFKDLDNNPIEDMCEECFKWIRCCVIMMKETGWKPDFHEKLKSESIWESDKAGYTLEDLQKKTGLKLF